MNILSSYGDSDEDEDECVSTPSPAVAAVRTTTSTAKTTTSTKTTSASTGGKTTKKLDISFLPVAIQEALARGETGNDSDSDDDSTIVAKPTSSKKICGADLMSLLPTPVENVKPSQLSSSSSSVCAAPVLSKPNSLAAYASQADKIFNRKPVPVVKNKTPAPVQITATEGDFILHSVNSAPEVHDRQRMTSSYETPLPVQHNPYPTSSRGEVQRHDAAPAQVSQTSSRKRDREIEKQLLEGGDTSSVTGSIQELDSSAASWNASNYQLQQKRESELKTIFNLGQQSGSSRLLAAPTKLQNRKHQLNSLVAHAADVELALLDAKGARNLTKAQTQGKYGW